MDTNDDDTRSNAPSVGWTWERAENRLASMEHEYRASLADDAELVHRAIRQRGAIGSQPVPRDMRATERPGKALEG